MARARRFAASENHRHWHRRNRPLDVPPRLQWEEGVPRHEGDVPFYGLEKEISGVDPGKGQPIENPPCGVP